MRPKIPVPPCRFCKKKFQRNEHLLRHERTHTNEKPFGCFCGQAFSRRDLLSRHSKQAHPDGDAIDAARSPRSHDATETLGVGRASGPISPPPDAATHVSSQNPSVPETHRSPTVIQFGPGPTPNTASNMDVDVTGHAAGLGSVSPAIDPAMTASIIDHAMPDGNPNLNLHSFVPALHQPMLPNQMPAPGNSQPWGRGFGEDLDLLWNDFDLNNSLLFPSTFPSGFPMNLVSLSHSDADELGLGWFDGSHDLGGEAVGGEHPTDYPHSRFASRLPSVASAEGERNDNEPGNLNSHDYDMQRRLQPSEPQRPRVPWRLSRQDYGLITNTLSTLGSVLGPEFEMPSRHALCRYIEGYFTGFHEHLPFIHRHAIDIATEPPELILAIAAVGARYRYQRKQCHNLYLSARAAVEHQLRQRDGNTTPPSIHSTPSFLSDGCSLLKTGNGVSEQEASNPSPLSADQLYQQRIRNVKTMQAMILLVALGTWNRKSLLKDAFSMASQLALMVREDGSGTPDDHPADMTWQDWIYAEGRRRTKIVAYCFMNLHTITYNISPKILNQEICMLNFPSPESHWRAENKEEWFAARDADPHVEMTIRDGFASLFGDDHGAGPYAQHSFSSFGNLVLIHFIVQQIFFLRCSSLDFGPSTTSLPSDVSLRLERGLRAWQKRWEATKDSSLDPSAPGGPLSFNATALFRLAYIRIHADFGPSRHLEIRDEATIARVYQGAPLLARTSSVRRAALQCAHSLSIPVRIGIEYVARTQTLNWSIVHSIGHLECALFLCSWLETMADVYRRGIPLEDGERRLLGIVMSILSETDFGVSIQQEVDEVKRIKRMCAAIFQLWALTFKGAHVFDIMGTIGKGLDLCAEVLQKELDC